MAQLLRQYFSDIRRLARPSDLFALAGGAAIFAAGVIVSIVDFVEYPPSMLPQILSAATGLVLLVLGSYLRVSARRTLGAYWSPVVRVVSGHKLVTRGVYRQIRHPGYAGEILIFVSVPLFFGSAYGVLVMMLICPVIAYRIRLEEKVLLETFGDEYRRYAATTKRLVPYVY